MIYRRSPVKEWPQGCFTYAATFEGQNYVQFGLGYESDNALQRKHVTHDNIHHLHALEEAERIILNGKVLNPGSLEDMLSDEMVTLKAAQALNLAQDIRAVHAETFGDPRDGRITRVPLEREGHYIFIRFVRRGNKEELLIGGGAVSQGISQQGLVALRLNENALMEWAMKVFAGDVEQVLFSMPPCAGYQMHFVRDAFLREIAAEAVKVGLKCWPVSAKID